MTFKEWNNVLSYAKTSCQNLYKEGFVVKATSYRVGSGEKSSGIIFQLLDDEAKPFYEYSSGTYDNLKDMKLSIDNAIRRIRNVAEE